MQENSNINIRVMHVEDIDDVINIEQQVSEDPWSPGIFRDCLILGYQSIVIEDTYNKKILAYGLLTFQAEEAHIINIAVRPQNQRQGYGTIILEKLLAISRSRPNILKVILEVNINNSAAIKLYSKYGFEEIGLRKNYYRTLAGPVDARIFGLKI